MTQAEKLIRALRRGWHTYGDLQALRISTCPWVRLNTTGWKYLKSGEYIERKVIKGLMRLRVVRPRQSVRPAKG
jgi:hypothetical protein